MTAQSYGTAPPPMSGASGSGVGLGRNPGDATDNASVGALLKDLAREVPSLMSKEVALAKSEMRETLESAKLGVAAVAMGGAVLLGGFIILLLAAVYALSNAVEPWLAALIVGGITAVIGYAMLQSGKRKFKSESLKPERTVQSLQKDKDAIRGRTP